MKSIAYVNHGRWVADCPFPGCTGAWALQQADADGLYPHGVTRENVTSWTCKYCRTEHTVVYPRNATAIERVLNARIGPDGFRNWHPASHPMGIALGFPDGETVEDLERENDELKQMIESLKDA